MSRFVGAPGLQGPPLCALTQAQPRVQSDGMNRSLPFVGLAETGSALLSTGAPMLVALAALAGATAMIARAWYRRESVRQDSRRPRWSLAQLVALFGAQRGSATLEFAMVFPILLGLVLVMLQTALLMGGQLFVHYAATAATRSAIVYIPMDLPGEPRNEIDIGSSWSDSKFSTIRRAAVFALVPVSGELAPDEMHIAPMAPFDTAEFTEALSDYFHSLGQTPPAWVARHVPPRMRYAYAYTEVTLVRKQQNDSDTVGFVDLTEAEIGRFDVRDPVTVRVRHRLNLSIPYARAVFSDGRHAHGGAYTVVEAQTTLTNEGLNPELPEPPDLPRRDRMEDDEP